MNTLNSVSKKFGAKHQLYVRLKKLSTEDLGGELVTELISEMVLRSRRILRRTKRVQLNSATGKTYFSFKGTEQSRPINSALYLDEQRAFDRSLAAFQNGFTGSTGPEIVQATYSVAYGVFGAHDVHAVGRKSSATFFEILIGHTFAHALAISPRNKIRIPESPDDDPAYLPTDYIFDLGPNRRSMHLPIKTSTRERAVQAWVHQLVLERIFGADVYEGVLVVASETKRDSRTGAVIEICVPRQLQMFQSRLTKMSRVYYLDPPQTYLDLANGRPRIDVKSFGEALTDLPQLLGVR